MAIRRYKKISELDAISSASLSTYVAGVDNGETVKITLDILAAGVRDTINTLDVQRLNALEVASASLSAATSSYETKGRNIVSSSAQITALGFISSSQMVDTGSFVTTSSFQSFSSSVHSEILAATNEQSFNGLISGSSQLTSSYDERYVLSGSITQTTWDNIASKPNDIISSSAQITTYGFVSGSYETTGRNILSGSILDLLPNGVVSGSSQILGGSGVVSGSYETTGRDILSGSISYDDLTNIPSGIISSSEQLPNGLISSSAQIDGFETTGRDILSGSILDLLPNGVVSGSSQILDGSGIYSSSAQIEGFETTGRGIISSSADLVSTSSFNEYTASISTASLVTSIDNLNTFTASQSTSSLVNRLNTIENVSGSWITESETGSFLTSLNGAISSSSELTSSFDIRYETTGRNIVSSSAQITSLGFISSSQTIDTGSFLTTSSFNSFTQSYQTDSASFDSRITNLSVAGVPSGTVSGSSQLTASYDTRYTLSGSIQPLPSDLISSSAQITSFGFVSGSYETTGRGIISESVVTISETQPSTGIGNLWYDSNLGNLYLHYDTNNWVDTSNGVIQTIISDGSLLSTASFNAWTASYTASVPVGTISSSAQITSFGFVSGSYETTGRGIVSGSSQITPLLPTGVVSGSAQTIANLPAGTISSSTQIAGLGYAITGSNIFTATQTIQGNLIVTGSLTAQTLIFSSSVYYSTASYSSGSTIFGNSIDDTHQYTGSVSITGSLTASLQTGYTWVGNGNNVSTAFPTSSLLSTASFNSFTSSQFNTLSASVAQVQTNLNQVTASLGVTSTPFNYTSIVNPTNYVLVSYPTASYNGGSMDIIVTRASDSTATSANCLLASYGGNGDISVKGSQNSGAGAPNPSFSIALSGSNMNIRISIAAGTYNIKGVARLF